MKEVTICFLVKKSEIGTSILLGMKKRGFGEGLWNGFGGKKIEGDKTIEDTVRRETEEEVGITPAKIIKVGRITFEFEKTPEWNEIAHIYLSTKWNGQPTESEEMKPKWFSTNELPYESMWPADRIWIPIILEGKIISGNVLFGENNKVKDHKIEVVGTHDTI